ncbi:MAG: hypothetical protein ACYCY9_10290 [Thiobacillus sp.]
MKKAPTAEYLQQAKNLSKEEVERLLARMRSKLLRKFEDHKLSALEVAAMQLEIEDEELNEWRQRVAEIKAKTKNK